VGRLCALTPVNLLDPRNLALKLDGEFVVEWVSSRQMIFQIDCGMRAVRVTVSQEK
jgi:hypothetical protein